MSANQGSLKATKSCSSEKLSLMGNSLNGEFGMRERWSTMIFSTLFYLESRDQILEEARSNKLVGP